MILARCLRLQSQNILLKAKHDWDCCDQQRIPTDTAIRNARYLSSFFLKTYLVYYNMRDAYNIIMNLSHKIVMNAKRNIYIIEIIK